MTKLRQCYFRYYQKKAVFERGGPVLLTGPGELMPCSYHQCFPIVWALHWVTSHVPK